MADLGADATGKERVAKFLARSGVASRREAERMVAAGRIALNGALVSHPATMVGPGDRLAVDGRQIARPQATRLWRYHKSAGLVTTARDPEGRPTVFSMLPKTLPRVISVGRLDINSEGLLLLTNDGGLARYLEHPVQRIPRTYRVRAHGRIEPTMIARMARGVTIDGVRYRPIQAAIDRNDSANCWLTMVLSEGRNREIKRLLEHFGLRVTRLIRTGYGPFELDRLRPNAVEEVPPTELSNLLRDYFA